MPPGGPDHCSGRAQVACLARLPHPHRHQSTATTHKCGCAQRGSRRTSKCSSGCDRSGARNDGTECASCCGAYPARSRMEGGGVSRGLRGGRRPRCSSHFPPAPLTKEPVPLPFLPILTSCCQWVEGVRKRTEPVVACPETGREQRQACGQRRLYSRTLCVRIRSDVKYWCYRVCVLRGGSSRSRKLSRAGLRQRAAFPCRRHRNDQTRQGRESCGSPHKGHSSRPRAARRPDRGAPSRLRRRRLIIRRAARGAL